MGFRATLAFRKLSLVRLLAAIEENQDLKIRLYKPRDSALTCQFDVNSVSPCVWRRRKLTLESSFFSFSGSVYYQGGHFTCADIKTCSVFIEYCSGTTTTRYKANIIARAFIDNRKSSMLQIWASGEYVIPFQRHLCTSIEYQNVNSSNIIWIRLIPGWRRCCPCYRRCCKILMSEIYIDSFQIQHRFLLLHWYCYH